MVVAYGHCLSYDLSSTSNSDPQRVATAARKPERAPSFCWAHQPARINGVRCLAPDLIGDATDPCVLPRSSDPRKHVPYAVRVERPPR